MKVTEKNFVDWEERFSIGIPLVDNQHKHLIDMTNELHKACRYSDDLAKEQFRRTVSDAVSYVKYHFSTEEQIMEKTAFPGIGEHKKIHAEFAQVVMKNVAAFEEGKKFVPNQFVRFLRDWVLSHVALVDSELGNFIVGLQKTGKLGNITMKGKGDGANEKKIVLAVDDSKTQLVQFKNILSPMYNVFTCISPHHALEMIKNIDIDLILLDLAMPEMTGFEFLQYLQNDPKNAKVPVIVVSGYCTENYITAAKRFGAIDFIGKPVRSELLVQKVNMQLES